MRILPYILLLPTLLFPNPLLPNPSKTPGDTRIIMLIDICNPAYRSTPIPIPARNRTAVFVLYNIGRTEYGDYRIDRLIPASLGGNNSIDNLWPQPARTEWGVFRKAELERRLVYLVCNGRMSLVEAQDAIVKNWIAAYKLYVLKPEYPSARKLPDFPAVRKKNK